MADEKRETALALYKGAEEEERRDAKKFSHDQRENKRETEEGIKSVARAYYERASGIEKKEVNEFLSSFDCTRERKIRLAEFKTHSDADDKAAAEDIFRVLDSNKNGLLDFDDILVLFYINKGVIGPFSCDGCGELLSGCPFFSCVPCLSQFPKTYELCCHCYSRGDFHHHHPSTDFLHDEGLVIKFIGQLKTKGEKEMEELQNIAMLHYNATPPDAKVKVKQFFYSMDRDADGKINERDFLSFMREQRLDHLRDGGFFEKIDMDGDGALCFEEVITLYYLIRSGRPHCDWCRKFIPGVFFSCIRCFKSQSSFILCRTCYQSNDCDHASDHGGATTFIDNYTLLDTIKQFPLHSNHQDRPHLGPDLKPNLIELMY